MDFGFSRKGKKTMLASKEEVDQEGDGSDEEPAERSKLAYETTHKREFKESWKKDYPWVMYDGALNNMNCGVCKEFPAHAEGNSFFVGTASFRIQNLKAHAASKAHITCQKAKCARENPTSTPMNLAISGNTTRGNRNTR